MNITQYKKQTRSLELASSVNNIAIEQSYHYNYKDSINNNNILEDNITYINIGVQGFHNRGKQRISKEYNLDIIGITETKLSSKQSKNVLKVGGQAYQITIIREELE